jgi:hypothetical protein
VLLKTRRQRLFELGDLGVVGADHRDVGLGSAPVCGLDDRALGELLLAQQVVDLARSSLEVALSSRSLQCGDDLGRGQLTSERRRGGDLHDRHRVAVVEVGPEDQQRTGVVVLQGVAQGVRLALAGPDGALVGPRENLDRLGVLRVAGRLAVVVAVGRPGPPAPWRRRGRTSTPR